MDIEKMTEALQTLILAAMTKAQECNHVEIAPEHVLLGVELVERESVARIQNEL